MSHRFTGTRILVTGASQGLGRTCAERFAREGATVVGTWSRDAAAAARTESELRGSGLEVRLVRADLGDPTAVEALWTSQGGGFDTLLLNAAYQKKADVEATDLALLEATFKVNVLGNFQLAKLFLAERRRCGKAGAIVVHSSNQAEFVNPSGFAYALSKAALNHMVRHLAKAAVKDRIRVNGVLLGWFDTDGERRFYPADQIRTQAATGIPMGRTGSASEAADLTLFLASDAASYMTGSLVRLDGGFALAPDLGT